MSKKFIHMPISKPGKYDEACEKAAEEVDAEGLLLIVINGNKGHGFSCSLTLKLIPAVPKILRAVADMLEAQVKEAKSN